MNEYLKNLQESVIKDANFLKISRAEVLSEGKLEEGFLQIIGMEGKTFWVPYPESWKVSGQYRSAGALTYRVDNLEALKRTGGTSESYAFGKWKELPRLWKNMKSGIVSIIDQGTCWMDTRTAFTTYGMFRDFKGFKTFPKNAVVEFKLKSFSKVKYNLPANLGSVFMKFKGEAKRLR